MNWRRGLFRFWLAVSVLWLVAVGTHAYENEWLLPREQHACADERAANPSMGNPFDCYDKGPNSPVRLKIRVEAASPESTIVRYSAWAILPPLGALVLAAVVRWSVAGFRDLLGD